MSDDERQALWCGLLDEFESTIADHGSRLEGLDHGEITIDGLPTFVPPSNVPPMPEGLRPRALELVRRNKELVARIADAADRIEPLDTVGRMRLVPTPSPSGGFDELA